VAWFIALIEITRFGWMLGLGKRWEASEKNEPSLLLFFVDTMTQRHASTICAMLALSRKMLTIFPRMFSWAVSMPYFILMTQIFRSHQRNFKARRQT